MGKPFFEVFPSLKLNKGIHDILEQTDVEKISATKRKDFLRIYLHSTRLIAKEDIWAVENEIKNQLFSGANMTIKIYERFALSSQYTPEKLIDIYRDSILAELREYSHIEYNAFKTAQIAYPSQDKVVLTVEDTVLVRSKEEELVRVLEKILVERCGFSVSIQVEYREAEEGGLREDEEQKIQMKVSEIYRRVKGSSAEESAGGGNGAGAGETVSKEGAPEAGAATAFAALADGATGSSGDKGSDTAPVSAARKSEFKRGEFKKGEFRSAKRSDNPDVLYGRDFEEEAMKIEDIIGEMGEVVIRGKILNLDKREIKNEKTIIIFDITDFTDTMTVKMFCRNDQVEEILGGIKPGAFVKVKGISMVDKFDHELTIGSIAGIKKIPDFTVSRMDISPHKRVELHCHTKMSDMDGVSEAKDIVKRAYKWGHRAIAITDHGVVQSFTDANHVWDDLWKAEKTKRKEAGEENPDKQDFFKIIYGMEAYLVDDLREIVTGDKGQDLSADFVVFDIETTGFSPVNNRIIEIGAVKVSGGKIVDRYSTFVNPEVPIPFEIEKLTSIRDDMVVDSPTIEVILPRFLEFCEGCVLVAHNANFDMSFIVENSRRLGYSTEYTYVDTVGIARVLLPNQAKHTLDAVAKTLGISLENHHRAVDDAEATAHIFVKFISMLHEEGVNTLAQVNELGASSVELVRRLPSYHAIILAKNDLGRINLYRLVSESHLTYFNRHPRVPKSLVMKYREGLILGSACEAGELYRALLDGQSDAQIARLVNFYDYLEIQPCGNNKFMIESEKIRDINSIEDIQNVNRKIVALGEQFHKPVVATCDVHFLDPEDEIYRRIIMAGKGFTDADDQAPLYL
ncbi:MAG: exonuclease domain-containing protein, partial [Acetatifactor sp.]